MEKASSSDQSVDRISGGLFVVLGLAVLTGSLMMPDYASQGAFWYEAPGLTPGILGIALAISGFILMARNRSKAAGGDLESEDPSYGLDRTNVLRIAIVAVLCTSYALVLVGRLPFWLATALFVFVFALVFEHMIDFDRGKLPRRIAIAIGLAAATSVAVTLLFQELFLVQLP